MLLQQLNISNKTIINRNNEKLYILLRLSISISKEKLTAVKKVQSKHFMKILTRLQSLRK
jgi:hypothetical protein